MTKSKRAISVLLTQCLAITMLAGMLIAAPVEVKAAIQLDAGIIIESIQPIGSVALGANSFDLLGKFKI